MVSWMPVTDVLGEAAWAARHCLAVARNEGVSGLRRWLSLRLTHLRRMLWSRKLYVIHVTDTASYAAGRPPPQVGGLEIHFLCGERDADSLRDLGYEDVRHVIRTAARWLRRGAVCVSVFVNREIAHVEWLALSEDVRKAIFPTPCYVDFAGGEAAWGGAHTVDRHRGEGVFQYGMACALHYCHERGYRALIGATAVGNAPSMHGQTPYAPRVRVQVRQECFLMRCTWVEISREACSGWPAEKTDISSVAAGHDCM